jgi:uncharacterized protein YndB with AHSA1/START domain
MPDVASNPVLSSIVVDAPIDQAFAVFTEGIASWWPPDHHIIEAELATMEFEPWVGGSIIDRGVDGSECRWARVLVYEPPDRIVFSWNLNLQWTLETDNDRTSEVEVRFTSVDPGRTRVDLEHREIQRHGDGWEGMHSAVGSPEGWMVGLERFAARLASGA